MSFLIHKPRMPCLSKICPQYALYYLRHPHAMSCLKNKISYSLLKPFTAFLLDFLGLFNCNARMHLFSRRSPSIMVQQIYIHVIFHEHEEYFWCSILHTSCSILTKIRFQMNICSLLYNFIN